MAFLEDSERVVSFLGQSERTRANAQDPVHLRTQLGDMQSQVCLELLVPGRPLLSVYPSPRKAAPSCTRTRRSEHRVGGAKGDRCPATSAELTLKVNGMTVVPGWHKPGSGFRFVYFYLLN